MKGEKKKTGSAKIDPNVLHAAKVICTQHDITLFEYLTGAVIDKNAKHGITRIKGNTGK